MAYYQQPGGYAPPPSYSPQPSYYGPPANQAPPQSHSPYQPMYNQQQPPYPPQQQQWGQPPPGQAPYGQQQQYNQPPQQQWGQQPPPPGQWGQQPPPQNYNYTHSPAPPPGGQYQQPPPQQGQYGAQPGTSHHDEPTAPRGADPRSDAIRIHKAVAGFGTNDRELVLTLAAVQNPSQMQYLRQTYDGMYAHETTAGGGRKEFVKAIEGDVSGDYGELCTALARNPPESDAHFVHKAIFRPGTAEDLLNDVLCGRSNQEIYQMKQAYRQMYNKDMSAAVADDLSMKTRDMFMLILDDRRPRADENAPCIPQQIDHDVVELKSAMRSGFSKDTNGVLSILAKRSDGQIRAINQRYNQLHGSLEKDIKKKFSGHMEDALLLMLKRGVDPIGADADQLEHSMKGIGTNELLLTNRVVQVHWDKQRLDQVRHAYMSRHRRSLLDRIRGETSGWYEKLLVELTYPGILEDPSKERKYKNRGQ